MDGPIAGTDEGRQLAALAPGRRDPRGRVVEGRGDRFRTRRWRGARTDASSTGTRRCGAFRSASTAVACPCGARGRSFVDPARRDPRRGPGVLDTPAGRLAVVISYERFFADRARSGLRGVRTVCLLGPTNASSYHTTWSRRKRGRVAVAGDRTGRVMVPSAATRAQRGRRPRGQVLRRTGLRERR